MTTKDYLRTAYPELHRFRVAWTSKAMTEHGVTVEEASSALNRAAILCFPTVTVVWGAGAFALGWIVGSW